MQKLKQLVQSENPACECLVTLSSEAAGTSLSDAYCWCVCVCVCVCVREYALKIYCISVKWAPHLFYLSVAFVHYPRNLNLFPPHYFGLVFLPIPRVLYTLVFLPLARSRSDPQRSLFSLLVPLISKTPAFVPEQTRQRKRHRFYQTDVWYRSCAWMWEKQGASWLTAYKIKTF